MQLSIKLLIDKKEKVFTTSFVSGKKLRKTLEISKKIGKSLTPEDLDELVEYEVDLYNNQFTVDQFYEGIDASVILKKALEDINNVISGLSTKMDDINAKN